MMAQNCTRPRGLAKSPLPPFCTVRNLPNAAGQSLTSSLKTAKRFVFIGFSEKSSTCCGFEKSRQPSPVCSAVVLANGRARLWAEIKLRYLFSAVVMATGSCLRLPVLATSATSHLGGESMKS